MSENIAVYMVGDSGIFFPGLVAFRSIQDHNADNPFDYFMCFDGQDLTENMRDVLSDHDIHFVDIAVLATYGTVDDLDAMKEQRWPNQLFNNWLFPYWLRDHGYKDALKVDYDILCVGKYELADVLPKCSSVSALKFNVDLLRVGVPRNSLAELQVPVINDSAIIPYYNAGVVGIDIERYVDAGTFGFFRYAYLTIQAEGATALNAEQVALAIVAYHSGGIDELPAAYNQRITMLPDLDAAGHPLLKNIHYLTHNKPWKDPDYRYLDGYVKHGRTAVYIYRDIWHQYAQTVPGYAEFVRPQAPSALETIGMYTTVLAAYHAK